MPKNIIDALDIELLKQLLEDSTQSSRTLSKKLNAHKDTIRKRTQKLCKLGIIERFSILINQSKLYEVYPFIWRVIFSIGIIKNRTELIKELLELPNVIEIDEATPSAPHDILVHAQFSNMKEFDKFTKYIKSKENVDSSKFQVTPIRKQYRRRKRIISAIIEK